MGSSLSGQYWSAFFFWGPSGGPSTKEVIITTTLTYSKTVNFPYNHYFVGMSQKFTFRLSNNRIDFINSMLTHLLVYNHSPEVLIWAGLWSLCCNESLLTVFEDNRWCIDVACWWVPWDLKKGQIFLTEIKYASDLMEWTGLWHCPWRLQCPGTWIYSYNLKYHQDMSVATCCAPLGPGPHWFWAASQLEPRPAPSWRTQPSAPVYWTISNKSLLFIVVSPVCSLLLQRWSPEDWSPLASQQSHRLASWRPQCVHSPSLGCWCPALSSSSTAGQPSLWTLAPTCRQQCSLQQGAGEGWTTQWLKKDSI